MTPPAPQQPIFYRPAEVAAMPHCSTWWVKEQARKRRIPYCWIGGGYRFTPVHIAEIARISEVRPIDAVTPKPAQGPTIRPSPTAEPDIVLRARTPRRAREAAGEKPTLAKPARVTLRDRVRQGSECLCCLRCLADLPNTEWLVRPRRCGRQRLERELSLLRGRRR